MATLVARDISKTFPASSTENEDSQPLKILEHISLELSQNQNLAIVGPSGSGKSTLLAILGTLDQPTGGEVTLGGVNPFALGEKDLAKFRSEHIGFVFQDHHLLPQCTVIENVLVPFLATGKANPAEVDRAERLIERVGLGERILHRPAQLSGGEKQRVAIARALVREPSLLLADEPTGNLDQATAETITRLLLDLQAEQETILIVVTHSTSLASDLQRRYELRQGRLEAIGSHSD